MNRPSFETLVLVGTLALNSGCATSRNLETKPRNEAMKETLSSEQQYEQLKAESKKLETTMRAMEETDSKAVQACQQIQSICSVRVIDLYNKALGELDASACLAGEPENLPKCLDQILSKNNHYPQLVKIHEASNSCTSQVIEDARFLNDVWISAQSNISTHQKDQLTPDAIDKDTGQPTSLSRDPTLIHEYARDGKIKNIVGEPGFKYFTDQCKNSLTVQHVKDEARKISENFFVQSKVRRVIESCEKRPLRRGEEHFEGTCRNEAKNTFSQEYSRVTKAQQKVQEAEDECLEAVVSELTNRLAL